MIKPGYKNFIQDKFHIIDKKGNDVPFILNPVQDRFFQKATGRDIALKARQEGVSAAILALFTVDFLTKENSRSVVVADISDNAIGLLDRVKYYIKSYEAINGVKVPLKYNSKYELRNEANNATYTLGTAENTEFGRSQTINNLHLSEPAFYKHFRKILASALQAVTPDGRVFIETTANGFNEFREFWTESEQGLTGFNPLFFRASDFYSEEFLEQKRKELKNLFKQEYPETSEEAFLTSGECYFDTTVLGELLKQIKEPIKFQFS